MLTRRRSRALAGVALTFGVGPAECGAAAEAGIDGFCYTNERSNLGGIRQAANPPTTAATPLLEACLEEAGLSTDDNEQELAQRMIDHGLGVLECLGL